MKTYLCLLRGINVSGHNKIKRDELQKIFESLGACSIQTYIQSGNVIFTSTEENITVLTTTIERKIKQSFGFEVVVCIRTKDEFQRIVADNPFPAKEMDKLHVMFLSQVPTNPPLAEIEKVKDTKEKFLIVGKEIYLYCPNGYGRTKLSNTFFERKLNVSATTRNWKTVTVLRSMVNSLS